MSLDGQIEKVLDRIIEGATFRVIATELGVSVSTLHAFLSSDEHSARAKTALALSAAQYADKAEEVLLEAAADKNELMRAKELAQHYRWKAGKRDPKKYGDKVDVTSGGEKLPTGPAIFQILPASQRPDTVKEDDE